MAQKGKGGFLLGSGAYQRGMFAYIDSGPLLLPEQLSLKLKKTTVRLPSGLKEERVP